MKKRIGGTSLFPKLVVAFLFVIIPLYGLGLMMNRLGEASVEKEWINSMNSRTMFYLSALEMEKKHIDDLLSDNIYDPDLSQLSILGKIMTKFEWAEAVKRVSSKMFLIKSSSIYVQSARAHLLTIGRTIQDNQYILDSLAEDYDAVKPYEGIDYSHLLVSGERLFMGQSFPEGSQNPIYMLSVEIDRNELNRTLKNLVNTEESGAAFIGMSGNWAVADQEHFPIDDFKSFVLEKSRLHELEGIEQMDLNGKKVQIAYRYSKSFDAYLCMYLPQSQISGGISSYRKLFWLLSFISILFVVLYSYWIYRLIHRPLQKMIRSFRKLEEGRLEPAELPKGNDEFQYLFLQFNIMVEKQNILIHDNYEQKIRAKHAQIKQLQSQINPHFLYNTCFILYRLSQFGDLENIGRFSRYLGEYYEFITRHKDDTIPLEIELHHTQTYIDIQNIRFSNRFEIEVAPLSESFRNLYVPKLILQPIIENAFKYALEIKIKEGKLRLGFEKKEKWLYIEIEDNGDQLTDGQIEELSEKIRDAHEDVESTGLINVHRRLQLMCGEGSGITLSRGQWGGLKVTVVIKVDENSI